MYGASVGHALKWFPERRGLAAGLTAAGFGAGSALTVVPIADMIANTGYESAFVLFGLGQGVVVMVCALYLRAPEPGLGKTPPSMTTSRSPRDRGPIEVLRSKTFW